MAQQGGKATSAFAKHGTYIENTLETIADYGSIPLVVAAMTRAGMSHAWVRIHGTGVYPPAARTQIAALIAALKNAGISVAGWGWCQGDDPAANAKIALQEVTRYQLDAYIADIEQGVHNANWTPNGIVTFCQKIKGGFQGSFGITSHPLIDWHSPELMKAALPFVDMFNPQVYWFNYPNKQMVSQFKRPNGKPYGLNDASEYTELCLDRWDVLMGATPKKIVLTGKTYWGEGDTQAEAESKLQQFIAKWTNFGRIIGLNWYSFGGSDAMSHLMLEEITAAGYANKPYGK